MLYDICLIDAGGWCCSNKITLELADDTVAKRKATQLFNNGSLKLRQGYSITDVWALNVCGYFSDGEGLGVSYRKNVNDDSSFKNQWFSKY